MSEGSSDLPRTSLKDRIAGFIPRKSPQAPTPQPKAEVPIQPQMTKEDYLNRFTAAGLESDRRNLEDVIRAFEQTMTKHVGRKGSLYAVGSSVSGLTPQRRREDGSTSDIDLVLTIQPLEPEAISISRESALDRDTKHYDNLFLPAITEVVSQTGLSIVKTSPPVPDEEHIHLGLIRSDGWAEVKGTQGTTIQIKANPQPQLPIQTPGHPAVLLAGI